MEQSLRSWKMPKVPETRIYRSGCFNLGSILGNSTICVGETMTLQDADVTIRLFSDSLTQSIRKKATPQQRKEMKLGEGSNCYLHIALVQVGVKPLSRQVSNDSIIMCLRDARYLDFKRSLLGLVKSSLKDGPIYFNCFTNLMLPMSDRNAERALTVKVMLGAGDKTVAGVKALAFTYRVYGKVLSKPYGEGALKESPLGQTTVYQARVRSNEVVSKTVRWDDVEIPEAWLKDVAPKPQGQRERVLHFQPGSRLVVSSFRNP